MPEENLQAKKIGINVVISKELYDDHKAAANALREWIDMSPEARAQRRAEYEAYAKAKFQEDLVANRGHYADMTYDDAVEAITLMQIDANDGGTRGACQVAEAEAIIRVLRQGPNE